MDCITVLLNIKSVAFKGTPRKCA